MNDFRVRLLEEQQFLIDLSKKLKRKKAAYRNLPEGRLRISSDRGKPRYYRYKDGECTYIRKTSVNMKQIRSMAQIEYEENVFKIVQRRLLQIDQILLDYSDHEIEDVFTELHKARK